MHRAFTTFLKTWTKRDGFKLPDKLKISARTQLIGYNSSRRPNLTKTKHYTFIVQYRYIGTYLSKAYFDGVCVFVLAIVGWIIRRVRKSGGVGVYRLTGSLRYAPIKGLSPCSGRWAPLTTPPSTPNPLTLGAPSHRNLSVWVPRTKIESRKIAFSRWKLFVCVCLFIKLLQSHRQNLTWQFWILNFIQISHRYVISSRVDALFHTSILFGW